MFIIYLYYNYVHKPRISASKQDPISCLGDYKGKKGKTKGLGGSVFSGLSHILASIIN